MHSDEITKTRQDVDRYELYWFLWVLHKWGVFSWDEWGDTWDGMKSKLHEKKSNDQK